MKVVWREAAEVQLYDQVGFIACEKPSTAEGILQTLVAGAERLGQFPDMGVKGRVPGTRELVIPYLPYILIYRKRVDRVEILALLNTSQYR